MIIESVLMVKGYRESYSYNYSAGVITPGAGADAITFELYKVERQMEGDRKVFSFPTRIRKQTGHSTFSKKESCISKIMITFSDYEGMDAYTVDSVEYESDCTNAEVTVEVHDAVEPMEYDYPGVKLSYPYFIGLILLVIGVFGLLAFIWHCWSVRFIIIKREIRQSGLTMR